MCWPLQANYHSLSPRSPSLIINCDSLHKCNVDGRVWWRWLWHQSSSLTAWFKVPLPVNWVFTPPPRVYFSTKLHQHYFTNLNLTQLPPNYFTVLHHHNLIDSTTREASTLSTTFQAITTKKSQLLSDIPLSRSYHCSDFSRSQSFLFKLSKANVNSTYMSDIKWVEIKNVKTKMLWGSHIPPTIFAFDKVQFTT